ncbi:MAG: glycosyltransferase family 4 protein [Sphingobacteriales bacterium]
MKLTYISTYPPRECGLASFNKSLINAISVNFDGGKYCATCNVIAINEEHAEQYNYPEEVKFVIRQQRQEDYREAANFINLGDTDACILQHEFGIFGGDSGLYVLSFINQLEKPLISILHTILEKPSQQQKIIIQNIAKRSEKVVVMGRIAINFLTKIYNIPIEKIAYIEHGAPDLEAPEINPVKADPLFKGRKILLTFGLLSRNKGLETVIRALPEIVAKHPDALYVILGTTHPGILKNSGEEYREHLREMAEQLNVSNNLAFVNRFVPEEELINYLTASDIYITPYLNEAQITSGTLSYAIGAGAAVVSTPYWHAKELLNDGKGRLFNFKDENGLAAIVNELLASPEKLRTIKDNAYEYGTKLRWPAIGRNYIRMIKKVVENPDLSERVFRQLIDSEIIPEFSLDYARLLTDGTGIVQHAKYGIPNRKEGYCVDDNARALIMALMAHQLGYKDAAALMPTYMSFLHFMQNDGGNFRNFLSYDGKYLDKTGSEDAFGRAVWALGYLVKNAPNNTYGKFGEELFHKAVPHFASLEYLRGISNTIIGLAWFLKAYPSDADMHNLLSLLTGKITDAYKVSAGENWHWFENYLTYDNAILPLALLHSAEITGDKKVLEIAFESISFLEHLTVNERYWNPVGNDGWYFRDGKMPLHDQQAIETMGMVLMYGQAYKVTRDPKYLKKVFSIYMWFLGENSLCIPLYDDETKGCSDGLQVNGINHNQGAESTLAYLISHLTVLDTFKTNLNFVHNPPVMESSL